MTTLYVVSVNLRLHPERAAQLSALLLPGDSILFTGSGLYGACAQDWSEEIRCYGLHADAMAAGYQPPGTIEWIDYAGMVSLCERHERCISG